ncbi:MAG: AAA family ATPase [Actinomycetota bacterium]
MRPTRLELVGFTSFREHTVIEFDDCEYFALVGPTGSGKSSVIDAICFALYGSVPRYDDKRLVAPVISQGKVEAKVRLDFTVNGDTYTAVRVVRRTPKGASVKEARLEKEGAAEPLAGSGPELTSEVTRLLGLTFEHFTKCVALPQGDFARFLHDDPKDRQEFLVKLLNLGVYEWMQQMANTRARVAKDKIAALEERLADVGSWATPETLKEAKAQVKRLDALGKDAADAQPAIDAFDKQIARAETEVEEAKRWLARIGDLSMPEDAEVLSDQMAAAEKLLAEAEAAVVEARTKVTSATDAYKTLPIRKPLDDALAAHDRKARLEPKIAAATEAAEDANSTEAEAGARQTEAEAAYAAALEARDKARVTHQAQHLAGHLVAGEPCPVCLQDVARLPKHKVPEDLRTAERAAADAAAAAETARKSAGRASAAAASARSALKTLLEHYEELESAVAEHPDRAAVEAELHEVGKAEKLLNELRDAEGDALDRAADARQVVQALKEGASEARAGFDAIRDSLAALEPPPATREDLAADWEALLRWAGEQTGPLQKRVAEAGKQINSATKGRHKLIDKLEQTCIDCAVQVDEGRVLEAVVAAHTSAERQVKDIEEAISKAAAARSQMKELSLEQETAHQLAQHLTARPGQFVSWIVNEALRRLVEGATQILRQLSNDQYALTIDDVGTFFVTDRNNAGEQRSARTLSGGETFLASLSLALALADQLGELAAEGAAHLDAIFLDEGFGTLDPETLDTVAVAVESLADAGRMVGIVTHVRELADRVPVRFRVKKDIRTSTVERVAS